jgi:hypothetical protein
MFSQIPRSLTTHFQFVPTCEQIFRGILSWAQTLKRSLTERQLSHKVHAYLIHNACLTNSQGTQEYQKKFMPTSFTTRVLLIHNSFTDD